MCFYSIYFGNFEDIQLDNYSNNYKIMNVKFEIIVIFIANYLIIYSAVLYKFLFFKSQIFVLIF